VYVRLPAQERDSITDVERYMVRTASGAAVPLKQVAELDFGVSPTAIRREDGQRTVTIAAEVDSAVIAASAANALLANEILARFVESYPGLTFFAGGEQARQVEALSSLLRGFAVAMLLIFTLLAIPLRSYTKPFVVMSIIPFGLIGVMVGHLVLQIPFGASAIMGVLGLSGVIVNDSLVMIDFMEQRLREGAPVRTALVDGAKGRFRPIFLTSITTFLGFTPIILEPSIQAQFLLPFAAAFGVGILVTTIVLMLVVPAVAALHQRVFAREA